MSTPGPASPRSSSRLVLVMLAMVAVPAFFTLHRVHVSAIVDPHVPNPSPYGYTVSLLLFLIPIGVIAGWLVPQEGLKISKSAVLWTIGLLFPVGAILDFFFAHLFLTFPNPLATLRIPAPALHGSVPIEEYLFYLTGFIAILLLYIWLDEFWLAAYTVAGHDNLRARFDRLLRFHPTSAITAAALIAAAIAWKKLFLHQPGFPGYLTFLILLALTPAAALFPEARPVINWRAFSLTLFVITLISLLWEATLGVPYGWWGYQPQQMVGITITAWDNLPIEAVLVWISVTYETAIVYEIIKRWKASGKPARHAFFGTPVHSASRT